MRNRLDTRTADRLLSGAVSPDDTPPGYVQVARLLEAAGRQAGDAGDTGDTGPERQAATVAAMQAAVLGHPVAVSSARGRRTQMPSKRTAIRAAGVAAAVVLGAGTAAAATDSLPSSAQNAAAHVFSAVGIHVATDTNGNGPNPHALPGLCNAQSHHKRTPGNSDVFEHLHCTGVPRPGQGTSGQSGSGPSSNATFGLCNARSHNGGSPGKSDVFSDLSSSTCTGVKHPGQGTGPADTTSGTGTSGATPEHSTPPPGAPPSSTPAGHSRAGS
jgi:hypothetical protein